MDEQRVIDIINGTTLTGPAEMALSGFHWLFHETGISAQEAAAWAVRNGCLEIEATDRGFGPAAHRWCILKPLNKSVRSHSADFTTVIWDGQEWTFSEREAAAISNLWEAMESGTPTLSTREVLQDVETESTKVAEVFKPSGAFNNLVVSPQRGKYRLAD